MNWQLPTGTDAPYLKLINLISTAITTGQLLPGSRLPPERQLAQSLHINRSTVQHAFNELVSRGILIRKIGSGTWVNSGKWGVLSQSVNWQSYLTTGRLSDPEHYMVQLRHLEADPASINLSHASITSNLALPITLRDLSSDELLNQETQTAITGATSLKTALVHRLSPVLGTALTPDQILITSGAQQAFYLITQGLLSYGDAIAIEAPSYFYQLSLFQAAGIRVFGVPLNDDGSLDLEVLQKLYYQHHLRFLFVNPTGQNPTSRTMPLAARQALITCCHRLQLPIVEDDPHGLTNAVTQHPIQPLKALDFDNVLYVGSLSTLTGAHTRIGWLIAPSAITVRLAEIRQQMEAGISIFPQIVATQLLNQSILADQINAQQHQLNQQQALLAACLAPFVQSNQLSYQLPQNGNSFWVHLHTKHSLTLSDYHQFLHHKVLVRPDFLFGVHQNCVRMSYPRLQPAQINDLQRRLATLLDELSD